MNKCGRKATKATKAVQAFLVKRLVSLRLQCACAAVTLQRELVKLKGINLDVSTVRKVLSKHGYQWLPKAQKRKYSPARKRERVRFAQAVVRLLRNCGRSWRCPWMGSSSPSRPGMPRTVRTIVRTVTATCGADGVRQGSRSWPDRIPVLNKWPSTAWCPYGAVFRKVASASSRSTPGSRRQLHGAGRSSPEPFRLWLR